MLSGCILDYASFEQKRMAFRSGENELMGTLIKPRKLEGPMPVLIFVSGDGEMNYDAYGYYRPFWESLAARGIGAFVWDKPGVGGSSGNWRNQSMSDRAAEVEAAVKFLRDDKSLQISSIGLIGFSQAGWVLPLVDADKMNLNCMIFVSTAIDWQEQSTYLTKKRLLQEGLDDDEEMQRLLESNQQITEHVFRSSATYDDYEEWYDNSSESRLKNEKFSPERFRFIQLNWQSNASDNLKKLKLPVLAVFGKDDLNVDASYSAESYRKIFFEAMHPDYTVKLIENATHSLTDAYYFNRQIFGFTEMVMINMLGRGIFATGALELIVDWADERLQ